MSSSKIRNNGRGLSKQKLQKQLGGSFNSLPAAFNTIRKHRKRIPRNIEDLQLHKTPDGIW
jgi:hypothetical protein